MFVCKALHLLPLWDNHLIEGTDFVHIGKISKCALGGELRNRCDFHLFIYSCHVYLRVLYQVLLIFTLF